jgi:hypothetical protein
VVSGAALVPAGQEHDEGAEAEDQQRRENEKHRYPAAAPRFNHAPTAPSVPALPGRHREFYFMSL